MTSEGATLYKMIQRCTNPEDRSFDDYGGRGIKVCADSLASERRMTRQPLSRSELEAFHSVLRRAVERAERNRDEALAKKLAVAIELARSA